MTRVRRVVASEIKEIVADYQAGMGCVVLARKYGISGNTVLGTPRSSRSGDSTSGKLSEADTIEVRRLQSEGVTYEA